MNPEAHAYYLRGRSELAKATPDGYANAARDFRRSIEIDSTSALGFAGLADTYLEMSGLTMPTQQANALARVAAARALSLDPNSAVATASLGYLQAYMDHDWPTAERTFLRALELSPGEATTHMCYGYLLHVNGRFDEARRQFLQACEIDPFSQDYATKALWPLFQGRHYGEAIAGARALLQVDTTYWYPHLVMGQAMVCSGQIREGTAEIERAAQERPDLWLIEGWRGNAYAIAGRRKDAIRILEHFGRRKSDPLYQPYAAALVCVALGDHEGALTHLERTVASGTEESVFLKVDPVWDPIRDTPRFQALLRTLRLIT